MSHEEVNIRLPPRIRQRIIDSATGSYPTRARTGDPDFLGNFAVNFDDTKTIVFSTGTLNYPSLVASGSLHLENNDTTIYAPGVARKGITDVHAHSNQALLAANEKLTPFNEERVISVIGTSCCDPWHLTGSTLEDVGPGFTSKLLSKTVIEVSLNPITEYSASISNGQERNGYNPITATGVQKAFTGDSNYPMMYFNFDKRGWEGVGRGLPTSITGTAGGANGSERSIEDNIRDQMYGFSPSYAIFSHAAEQSVEGLGAAAPFTNFGFPVHAKFAATSSQLLDMSKHITQPFVLEKIVYEFSGSYKTGSMAAPRNRNQTTFRLLDDAGETGDWGAPICTFFILNQRTPYTGTIEFRSYRTDGGNDTNTIPGDPDYGTKYKKFITASIPTTMQLSKGGPQTFVNSARDIVTFAQVSALGVGYDANAINVLSRDLNIKNRVDAEEYWAGEFILSASVRSPVVTEQLSAMFAGINDTSTLIRSFSTPGGRNGTGLPTGRDLTSSVLGNQSPVSFLVSEAGSIPDYTVTPGTKSPPANPYILFPSDKLAFGWQTAMGRKMYAEGYGTSPNLYFASELTIKPGKGRLLLYGSLIRNGKEFHDTRNPPLTSPAVHEDIHSDNPVLDQFDTEPRQQFSGSYIGDYVTGSMTLGAESYLLQNRGVATQTIAGVISFPFLDSVHEAVHADPEGNYRFIPGFIRGIQIKSESERYFDTIMPRITDITVINGGEPQLLDLGVVRSTIVIGERTLTTPQADDNWIRAFPFEPKYASVPRLVGANDAVLTRGTDGEHVAPLTIARTSPAGIVYIYQPHPSNQTYPVSGEQVLVEYFGFGSDNVYTGSVNRTDGKAGQRGSKPEGFKYGILNVRPTFSKAIMRYDTYGQFRDILEQRLDSKFYDIIGIDPDGTKAQPGGRTGPIQIQFVENSTDKSTEPGETHSSNLSYEATSSLPYFDGVVRNREDPLRLDLNSSVVSL